MCFLRSLSFRRSIFLCALFFGQFYASRGAANAVFELFFRNKKEKPRFGQNTTHQNKPSFAAPITVSEDVPRYFACDMRAFPG